MSEYNHLLRTFGGAVLEDVSGRNIALPPKPLALLVILRLHAPDSRRELERFLWQGARGDTSNALSQALGTLRRLFPDLPHGKGSFTWPGREGLACDVDILVKGEQDPETRRAAVFVYRGTFLKDFRKEEGEEEFRRWVEQRQDQYEAVFRQLWQAEVKEAVGGERWKDLEKLARHAVALDPYWESGHAALVRALASGGNAAAARRHVESVRRQLEEDGDGYALDEGVFEEAASRIDEWAVPAPVVGTLLERRSKPEPAPPAELGGAPPPVPVSEPAPSPGPSAAPRTTRPARRLRYTAAALAGGLLLAAVATAALSRRSPEPASPPVSAPRPSAAGALCRPGEARAMLVEQDFKADPMNVLPPNTHFTTVWHLQNTGSCTWPASFRLHRVGEKPLSISDRDIPAQRTVAPGDTILFPSSMVAPPTTGTYDEAWVLLETGGDTVPFSDGRRALAARVHVPAGPPSACEPGDVRAELVTRGYPDDWPVRPGERFTYEWTFMNRAKDCAWDVPLALRFVSASPTRMSDDTVVQIVLEERVLPSQGYTFEIPMRAPDRPGTYSERWSLVYGNGRVIPVQNASDVSFRLAVRGDPAALPMPPLCRRGQYAVAWMATERIADGTVIPPGGRFVRKWTLANKGSCTWDTGLSMRYVRSEGGRRTGSLAPIPISRPVPPRASYTFTVPMQAPRTGTRYREYWSVVDPFGDTAQVSLVKAIWAEVVIGTSPGESPGS